MNRRIPVAIAAAVALVLIVVGAVAILRGGAISTPNASPTPSARATATPAPTDPTSSPEGVVRAFFAAYAAARQSDDPAPLLTFVTDDQSSAYLSAAAFLLGQKQVGKASVTTVQRLENLSVETSGPSATVTFDFTEGGYDIDLKTGKPMESPQVLPTARVVATVRQVEGRWLLDDYESK